MVETLSGVPVIVNRLLAEKTVRLIGKGTPNPRIEVDSMDTLRELLVLLNKRQVANG